MSKDARLATRRDYQAMVRLRAEWLDEFVHEHPARERWCPSGCRVPRIEDETELLFSLTGKDGRGAAVLSGPDGIDAFVLWRTNEADHRIEIQGQTPRVCPHMGLDEAGNALVELVIQHAVEHGMPKVCVFLHGFPDEVHPLIGLYRRHGFVPTEGHPRLEMLGAPMAVSPDPNRLQFRSAKEIGLDEFHETNAALRGWSVEQSVANGDISERMWGDVRPETDWLVAYEGEDLVGVVQMAVTRDGIGVVDGVTVVAHRRGRGLGMCLLSKGLAAVTGRTDVVWLDVDHDNAPAVQLYKRAGFRVHHQSFAAGRQETAGSP